MLQTDQRSNFGYLARRLDRAVEQMLHRHFSHFSPSETWSPAINAYRFADRIEVCVDLAGVEPDSVEIEAHPHQVVICGLRQAPQPPHEPGEATQLLVMEIDHGPFRRTIHLPRRVDVDAVSARSDQGLLWIHLPLKPRQHRQPR